MASLSNSTIQNDTETKATDVVTAVSSLIGALSIVFGVFSWFINTNRQHVVDRVGKTAIEKRKMGYFTVRCPWYYGRSAVPPKVPNLSIIIRAGDNIYFTSSMFDGIPAKNETVTWSPLYTAFFDELAWKQWILYGPRKSQGVLKRFLKWLNKRRQTRKVFLNACLYEKSVRRAVKDALDKVEKIPTRNTRLSRTTDRHMLYVATRTSAGESQNNGFKGTSEDVERGDNKNSKEKCARQLANCIPELETVANAEVFKYDPITGNKESWTNDVEEIWIWNNIEPCIQVSAAEIGALAFMLGMPLIQEGNQLKGMGIFGISLRGERKSPIDPWRLRLIYQRRLSPKQEPSKGSGFSSLWAIRMACGFLPFGRSKDLLHVVHVTEKTLHGIKHGLQIKDTVLTREALNDEEKNAMEYLEQLPSSFRQKGYRSAGNEHDCPGRIYQESEGVSTWTYAVARVAFGGLVPMATLDIVRAVRFTTQGDGSLSEDWALLVSTLKELIIEVQKENKELRLFNRYIEDRAQSEIDLSLLRPSTKPGTYDTQTAAAFLARCMTMLEYRTEHAEYSGDDPQDKPKKVLTACANELQNSYRLALSQYSRSQLQMESTGHENSLTTKQDLESLVIGGEKPVYDITKCGKIAHYIILLWTYYVGIVVWSDKERREAKELLGHDCHQTRIYSPVDTQKLTGSFLLD